MPFDDPEADLNAFAAALGRLQPAPPASRDRILFAAGRESTRRRAQARSRLWPGLAAGLAAVALGEAALLARLPRTTADRPIVAQREPSPPRPVVIEADRPARTVALTAPGPPLRLGRPAARFAPGWDVPPAAAAGHSPTLPPLTGRELLRRELRSALLEGGRS